MGKDISINLQNAIDILTKGGHTCVLTNGDEIYTSKERGIKPLIYWLEDGKSKRDFSAADKVVGKAAAFLYVLLEVREVYAKTISEPAINVLKSHNIGVHYDTKADYIKNRTNTGRCPMESAVLGVKGPDEALAVLKEKLQAMK